MVTTSEGQAFIQKAKNIMKDVASLKGEFEDTAVKQEKLRISVPRASYITYAFTKYVNSIPHESQLSISLWSVIPLRPLIIYCRPNMGWGLYGMR